MNKSSVYDAFENSAKHIYVLGPSKVQNIANARQKVQQAASQGASLIVLLECFNSPY